jgi:hypothetical protein
VKRTNASSSFIFDEITTERIVAIGIPKEYRHARVVGRYVLGIFWGRDSDAQIHVPVGAEHPGTFIRSNGFPEFCAESAYAEGTLEP